MRSYVCTRDIHKRVFANYIFANITSFAKFTKISSCENFQVHGIQYQPYLNDTNCSKVCPCAPSVVIQLYMHLSNVILPRHLGLPQVMIIGGDCHTGSVIYAPH